MKFFLYKLTHNFFAIGPTQKVGLLRCFSLAFDNTKNWLQKRSKLNFSSTPQLREELFSIQAKPKTLFFIINDTKSGTPTLNFARVRQL